MVTWFVTIGGLGLYHVARQPAILGALSPHHGVRFFMDNGASGFRVLGGVVLAVTGGEAPRPWCAWCNGFTWFTNTSSC
jgi:KUP system potassium uptake protein